MNILVSGGAGYIGSHTILEIYEHTDWNVISVDNYINSTPETYDRIEKISGKRPTIYELDICKVNELEIVFKENRIEGVIHFAALKSVPESVEKPLLYIKNNLLSLMNLLEMSAKYNVLNFIFSSSCAVYGNTTDLPVSEKTEFGKAESPYAYTKQAGESIIDHFATEHDQLKFISLRYFNPVGAHLSGDNGELPNGVPNNLVPYIAQTAAGIRQELTIFGGDYNTRDGTCVRDYIHISDIANAHIKALQYIFSGENTENHEVMNLGTGVGISVLEAVRAFEEVNELILNYKIGPRRAGDIAIVYADNKLAEKKLGWKPLKTLNEMMESAWLWEKSLGKF